MRTYADVRMNDQADAKKAVEDWVSATAGHKCGDGERDEASGEQTLKGPVIGAMYA